MTAWGREMAQLSVQWWAWSSGIFAVLALALGASNWGAIRRRIHRPRSLARLTIEAS